MKDRFNKRALSHSQLSSWEYNKDDWYTTYIIGKRSDPTPEMLAGSRIGDSIGTDQSEVPDLNPPGVKEYELSVDFDGISLIGYADHFCPDMLVLHENKTSPNKKRWTQSKVDQHHQLTMYALMLNLRDGIEPEDIEMWLNFIPVRLVGLTYKPDVSWRAFETRRTKADLDLYKRYIISTVEAMERYIQMKKLSTPPRPAPVYK
jgi:hypothetical protein